MPLFEYLCESCGRRTEVLETFSAKRPSVCDRCGGPLKRLISAPSVQFKGSGWYVSDYGRAGSSPKPPESEKAGESGTKEAASADDASGDSPSKDSSGKDPSKKEPSKKEPSKKEPSKKEPPEKTSSKKDSGKSTG